MDGYLASWVQHFQAVARQLGRWVSGWNDASALQYFLLGVLSRAQVLVQGTSTNQVRD